MKKNGELGPSIAEPKGEKIGLLSTEDGCPIADQQGRLFFVFRFSPRKRRNRR